MSSEISSEANFWNKVRYITLFGVAKDQRLICPKSNLYYNVRFQ